jgi:hypothetical protein
MHISIKSQRQNLKLVNHFIEGGYSSDVEYTSEYTNKIKTIYYLRGLRKCSKGALKFQIQNESEQLKDVFMMLG